MTRYTKEKDIFMYVEIVRSCLVYMRMDRGKINMWVVMTWYARRADARWNDGTKAMDVLNVVES